MWHVKHQTFKHHWGWWADFQILLHSLQHQRTRAWTINPQTGNILKCVLYTYHNSTKSSLEHQSEAGWLSRPTRVLPHFGPPADPFRPFKMMVGAITAVDRLLLHFSGHSGPITYAHFSWLYNQSFHSNLQLRNDSHASGEMRGLNRGELPLLPYHHNRYQQQPSHRVM